MEFKFPVPENWSLIDRADYEDYGINEEECITCISAYTVNSDESMSIVCFLDFENFDLDFLIDYDDSLSEMNNVEVEDSELAIKNIFHGFLDGYDKVVFANIMKIQLPNDSFTYSVQIFIDPNEDDVEEYNDYVYDYNNDDDDEEFNEEDDDELDYDDEDDDEFNNEDEDEDDDDELDYDDEDDDDEEFNDDEEDDDDDDDEDDDDDDDEDGLICVQCSVSNLDENDPIASVLELPFVKHAIDLFI